MDILCLTMQLKPTNREKSPSQNGLKLKLLKTKTTSFTSGQQS